MKIVLWIISALSVLVALPVMATANSAIQEAVGVLYFVNFTLCMLGIAVVRAVERIGTQTEGVRS